MGQGGLEPSASRLSSVRSNQLSYWPIKIPKCGFKFCRVITVTLSPTIIKALTYPSKTSLRLKEKCRTTLNLSTTPSEQTPLIKWEGLNKLGRVLLSHALRRSTISAVGFHDRIRDGLEWTNPRHDSQANKTLPLKSTSFLMLLSLMCSNESIKNQTQQECCRSEDCLRLLYNKATRRVCRISAVHPCKNTII